MDERVSGDAGRENCGRRKKVVQYLANELEPLSRGDVPLPALLDLGEDPWLDECAAADHDPVHVIIVDLVPVILRREAVAAPEYRHRRDCQYKSASTTHKKGRCKLEGRTVFLLLARTDGLHALLDVVPVGELRVPLLPCAAV